MDHAKSPAEGTRAFFGGIMVVMLIMGPVITALLILFKLFVKSRDIYYRYKIHKEAIELVGPAFRFKKVRARGQFIIGDQDVNEKGVHPNESHHDGGAVTELDEARLIVISQNKNKDLSKEGNSFRETSRKTVMNDAMEINLEKGAENSVVEIYTKKQANLKRRKVNLFRDNFFPVD